VTGPVLAHAGEPGSFGEDAALAYRPDCRTVAVATFRDVFVAVADHAADGGVVPIENISQGTVREVYDLLLEHQLVIVGEAEVPVRLCLAALPGQSLDRVERVYSHVQALSQAEPFLRGSGWTLLATATTASAGADLVRRGELGAAAVLSPRAAELHGLEVLAEDIQSDPRNRTRFLVLAREPDPPWAQGRPGARRRTTLAFGVANEPGTLLRVLSVLAEHDLNMSKIESRPSRERDWEYVFLVDLDADLSSEPASPVMDRLRAATVSLRVLGCYPVAAEPAGWPEGSPEPRLGG
jgi:prephenate dehydratase